MPIQVRRVKSRNMLRPLQFCNRRASHPLDLKPASAQSGMLKKRWASPLHRRVTSEAGQGSWKISEEICAQSLQRRGCRADVFLVKICLLGKVTACLVWALITETSASGAEQTGASSSDSREAWIADILALRPKAEQGDTEAQVALGDLFLSRQQFTEAVHWYRHAATNREVTAQLALAGCLIAGRGTAENRKEAAYWIRKAADGVEQGEQRIGGANRVKEPTSEKPQKTIPNQSKTVPDQLHTNIKGSMLETNQKNFLINRDSRSTPEERSSNVSAVEPRTQESGLVLQPFEIPK